MGKYCVYCFNGIHKTYYRKSKDFILTKDYRVCEKCGRRRRLVEVSLFPIPYQSDSTFSNATTELSFMFWSDVLYYIPLNIVVRSYRFFKKCFSKKDVQK